MGFWQRWKLNRELKRIKNYCQENGINLTDSAALQQIHISKKHDPALEQRVRTFDNYLLLTKANSDDPELQAFKLLKEDPFYEKEMRKLYDLGVKQLFTKI